MWKKKSKSKKNYEVLQANGKMMIDMQSAVNNDHKHQRQSRSGSTQGLNKPKCDRERVTYTRKKMTSGKSIKKIKCRCNIIINVVITPNFPYVGVAPVGSSYTA